MPATSSGPRARLPAKWADEMARAPRTAATAHKPQPVDAFRDTARPGYTEHESLSPEFDVRLDDFLSRFHTELVAARAAKDVEDAGGRHNSDAMKEFRSRMQRIQDMYAAEGKDFADELERRNPAFATATANYGENTLELARGIERLERAVRDEESKRATDRCLEAGKLERGSDRRDREKSSTGSVHVSKRSGADNKRHRADQNQKTKRQTRRSTKSFDVGYAALASNIPTTAPPSLSNLHSDETLCLMQSDIQALKLELMRLQRSKAVAGGAMRSGPCIPSSGPGDSALTSSTVSPAGTSSCNENGLDANGQRHYVSHLEQMKSRLDALEKKPLARSTRKRSQARIGRTRTLNNMYSSSIVPESQGAHSENFAPNIRSDATPPLSPDRHMPLSSSSRLPVPPDAHIGPTVVKALGEDDFYSAPGSICSSTPSPNREAPTSASRNPTVKKGLDDTASPKARLFSIDGPEELLTGPQSHAAAKDIQRYSLKVARRLGPVPDVPSEQQHGRLHDEALKDTLKVSGPSNAIPHRPGPSKSELVAAPGHNQTGPSPESPSTFDTVNTAGSGSKVVEEMEGDIWMRRGNLWKRWRRRYASIVSHQFFGRVLCLFSYDSAGNVISSRSEIIVLSKALCRAVRDTVEAGGELQHMFVLRTSKEYYFATSSDEERRKWIRELREAARDDGSKVSGTVSYSDAQAATVETKQARGPAKKLNVGRSVTHLGTNRLHVAHSGTIPVPKPRRVPFRRTGHLW